jgi:hypothetical protein
VDKDLPLTMAKSDHSEETDWSDAEASGWQAECANQDCKLTSRTPQTESDCSCFCRECFLRIASDKVRKEVFRCLFCAQPHCRFCHYELILPNIRLRPDLDICRSCRRHLPSTEKELLLEIMLREKT